MGTKAMIPYHPMPGGERNRCDLLEMTSKGHRQSDENRNCVTEWNSSAFFDCVINTLFELN